MADPIDDIHRHIVPYQFREFPKHLHRADGSYLVVTDAEGEAAARKDGWYATPDAAVKGEKRKDKDKGEKE